MNKRLLAYEYIVAVGVVSWAAIKGDNQRTYAPWPPAIIYTSAAFGILSLLNSISPELAGILGAGFLLAILVRAFQKESFFTLSGLESVELSYRLSTINVEKK